MRLLWAELLKIWTAPRTLLGVLLAEVAIVLIGVITTLHSAVNDPVLPDRLGRDIVGIAGTSLLVTTLTGALIATTEFRHGTITLAFLAAPVREKVIAAKTGATVIVSTLLVLVSALVSVGIARVWVGGRSDYRFGSHEYALIARLFLAAAIVSLIGLFIGLSLKRQLGAVIIVLGWLFFAEPAIEALFSGTAHYLVGHSIGGVLGGDQKEPSLGHALSVLAVYLAGLGTVAVAMTRRRDIT
jgi:hypothetical protein